MNRQERIELARRKLDLMEKCPGLPLPPFANDESSSMYVMPTGANIIADMQIAADQLVASAPDARQETAREYVHLRGTIDGFNVCVFVETKNLHVQPVVPPSPVFIAERQAEVAA